VRSTHTSGQALLFERPRSGDRAVLVHVEFPSDEASEDLDEFEALVSSAGATAVGRVVGPRQRPDPRYFAGKGKAEEIGALATEAGSDVVIFNHALSPAQERNLERVLQCRVLDRIGLILDIFAQRASTFEGKLQVELAQLRHLSTRLVRGWSHLERQKGGIGLRGPGEKQLETDRRLLAERIRQIRRRLEGVRNRRELSRRARRKAEVPVVSLVGYTNAGKSTLFNRLTGADALVENRLFATLDPTLRRLEPEAGSEIVLADTVGFIRHLPHELVAAFRATLEETLSASLLLHVVDAAASERGERREQVNEVLRGIGAERVSQLEVYNKVDATDHPIARSEHDEAGDVRRVWVSARTGAGLDLLRAAVAEHVRPPTVVRRVRLGYDEGRLRSRLHDLGTVLAERADAADGWVIEVQIEPPALERLHRNEGLDRARVAACSAPSYDRPFARAARG